VDRPDGRGRRRGGLQRHRAGHAADVWSDARTDPKRGRPNPRRPRGAAELVWVDEARLAEAGVKPWEELPLWVDLPREPDFRGFLAVDIGRALAAGLTFRPFEETVADTLAWTRRRHGVPAPAGLTREREAELLERLAP
jgi:hypothetical protein